MLAKLIKYDLKYLLKSVALFGGLLLICAILFNITGYDYLYEIVTSSTASDFTLTILFILQFLHTIFYNAIFIIVVWLVLNSIMRIWHRYRASFLSRRILPHSHFANQTLHALARQISQHRHHTSFRARGYCYQFYRFKSFA